MKPIYELKPNKDVFLFYQYAANTVVSVVFLMLLYLFLTLFFDPPKLLFTLALGIYLAYKAVSIYIRYKKEKYEFYEDKIVFYRGNIFSDHKTELVIKNVTHVKMILPFIEHNLFKTGALEVQSAGSVLTQVRLSHIDHPEKMYEFMQQLMKSNKFGISQKKLLIQEKANPIGVLVETCRDLLLSLFFIAMFASYFYDGIRAEMQTRALALLLMAFAVAFFMIIPKAMDLLKRVYRVYDDCVFYDEGFLTKNHAFMPAENLSDASVTQSLVARMVGVYDIVLSCQGSGQEVKFNNVENGEAMEKAIDTLISEKKLKPNNAKSGSKKSNLDTGKKTIVSSEIKELRMDKTRTLAPPICLGALILLLGMIGGIIGLAFGSVGFFLLAVITAAGISGFGIIAGMILCTSSLFTFKQRSVEYKFNFIYNLKYEFENEKITGIVIRESLIDLLFGTCSIAFWSIGSSQEMIFKNIKKWDGYEEELLERFGMKRGEKIYTIQPEYSLIKMFKSMVGVWFLAGIIFVGGIAALGVFGHGIIGLITALAGLAVVGAIWGYCSYYYSIAKMELFKNHIEFSEGVVIREHYLAYYNDIKDITTRKYFISDCGEIYFNIAGERLVQTGENKQMVSNSFTVRYTPDIEKQDELIDTIFLERPSIMQIEKMIKNPIAPLDIETIKPDAANSIFLWTIVYVILGTLVGMFLMPGVLTGIIGFGYIAWGGLLGYAVVIGIVWLSVHMTSYTIQKHRVLGRWGIIYKHQISVLNKKIDFINQHQGMVNKIFGNGTLTVNTSGSSAAEMIIANIHDYQGFYERLKKNYEN